jgi:hypothetical protein
VTREELADALTVERFTRHQRSPVDPPPPPPPEVGPLAAFMHREMLKEEGA